MSDPTSTAGPLTATKPGPEGIGGWLLLPVLGLVLTPPLVLFAFYRDFTPLFEPGVWDALTTPGSRAYHPLFMPLFAFEVVVNLGLVVASCFALWKMKEGWRGVPKLMIGIMLANVAFQLIDTYLGAQYAEDMGQREEPGFYKELIRAIVGAVIWIPYFLVSKRVKNTFIN